MGTPLWLCFATCGALGKTVENVGTMTDPSLITVQTYALIVTYLLNAGQYETAYTMIGLAICLAYALSPQTGGINTIDLIQADRSRKTWWILVQLDLKCSLQLGRPMAARYSTPPILFLPLHNPDAVVYSQYQFCWSKLTAAMLQVSNAPSARNVPATHSWQLGFRCSNSGNDF
ncbi:hypothetical protein AYO21_05628 [Fonsecaea monophora]|uniref:Xylanolytic transcriptional activator regulatory domain-containing protein n=1 Tax=Fonsecaea monophora TaxID=254056 RepID=A0A177F965_9EURO|nr:hypothetical protein AYO21_05628 [Fonsecaea monophora]OAG40150.1 hypothetical protein AYO21_05628 [Fonsecaea monophora]